MKKTRYSLFITFLLIFLLFIPKTRAQQITPTPSFQNAVTLNPTPILSHPFDYTPLPTNNGGPENDIIEVAPLTVSRNVVQVDDWVTLSVTVQNRASYSKTLQDICFESTDGNFGCQWGIKLNPEQSFTINTWVLGQAGESKIFGLPGHKMG